MADKIFSWLSIGIICTLVLTVGCTQLTEKTVTTAMKFAPNESTTYKLTTESQKRVEFEGALLDEGDFEGGQTSDKVEMVFTQQIQGIGNEGEATARITIKELKYISVVKDVVVLDFDSSRAEDQNSPMAKLIGEGYTITISPTGEISGVSGLSGPRTEVRGTSAVNLAATKLLSPETISDNHGSAVLPVKGKNRLKTGDSWSVLKTFSFGMMGSKSYEKIYTLKEIEKLENREIAIVDLNAIPSAENAEQLQEGEAKNPFSEEFDVSGTYTGQLRFDLTSGKVEKYSEKFQSEWVIVDPTASKEDKEPGVLKMGVVHLYNLEKID